MGLKESPPVWEEQMVILHSDFLTLGSLAISMNESHNFVLGVKEGCVPAPIAGCGARCPQDSVAMQSP